MLVSKTTREQRVSQNERKPRDELSLARLETTTMMDSFIHTQKYGTTYPCDERHTGPISTKAGAWRTASVGLGCERCCPYDSTTWSQNAPKTRKHLLLFPCDRHRDGGVHDNCHCFRTSPPLRQPSIRASPHLYYFAAS